jgi:hypothetical protein
MSHYILIRHKVKDFAAWKTSYATHKPARDAAGLTEKHLLHGDEGQVVMLFHASDLAKAKAFTQSPDLKQAMQNAGVVDHPDLFFLMD